MALIRNLAHQDCHALLTVQKCEKQSLALASGWLPAAMGQDCLVLQQTRDWAFNDRMQT